MNPLQIAGNHGTSAKCGKTCNQCKAREKLGTSAKRAGKTAGEPFQSVVKHLTGGKRGKHKTVKSLLFTKLFDQEGSTLFLYFMTLECIN